MRQFKKHARVLLIDDNYDHLKGVKELLEIESTYDVVGATTSANVGLNLIKRQKPDVVLLDMNMPEKDGLQTIQEIEKLDIDVKVLALSAYDDADLIFRAMKLGAKGYVLKTMASGQLICAIDEVSNGKIYMPSTLTARFFDYFQKTFKEEKIANEQAGETNLLSDLTQREEEVLDLLTQGITYKGVARQLFISETTVKTHVNNIFQKLQVNDRTQAVLYAINHNFNGMRQARMNNKVVLA
ncbi:response regulator transcription factor [bacterium]|nr:response regulator transcription factor [bacterium]